jgi:bifunctional non-homologous end joining protein LigD
MSSWRDDPADVRPMLASLADPPVAQRGLVYEPKYDGIRALIDVRPSTVRQAHGRPEQRRGAARSKPGPHVAIYSRNGNDKTAQFPEIVEQIGAAVRGLRAPILLDGEIVAVDAEATPLGFQHVQGRIHLTSASDIARAVERQPAALVVFDLLRDGDEDVRGKPLAERRLRLQQRVKPPRPRGVVRLSEIVIDDGRSLLQRARAEGWEGLIVKDGDSVYHSGRRTPAWRKMKLLKQQEFVVGGWTDPRQTRAHFGALLVGYYDEGGALRWAGSVGTGFDQAELDRVAARLRSLAIPKSPFDDQFKTATPAHWVKPELVAEVRFTEWTSDGLLRQPVYLGMRADKKARSVRREDKKMPAKPALPAPAMWKKNRRTSEPRNLRTPEPRNPRTPEPQNQQSLLEQLTSLERAKKDGEVTLPGGDRLRVTNLAKPFWPALGITKGDLLRYYVEVSPYILPVVDDRPMVMKRFPNGVEKQAFYQQRHPDNPPAGVRRIVLPEAVEPIGEEGPRDRLIGGSLTTLLYMTQIAAISQDPWFSRVADPMHADQAAIDLDPGEGVTFARVLDVARWVKEELDRFGIPALPKTSGASGLHIYIPLPKKTSYDTGQVLCRIIATIVATKHPKAATVERMVKRRPRGTVYVDYLQNILGKTLACAYSARASDYAGVSTPLTWKEIEKGIDPKDFTIRTAPARFRDVGDLWAPIRQGKPVDLAKVLRKSKTTPGVVLQNS